MLQPLGATVALCWLQRGHVAAQPWGLLSDPLEVDCCDARAGADLGKADVPLTTAEAANANAITNAIRKYFVIS